MPRSFAGWGYSVGTNVWLVGVEYWSYGCELHGYMMCVAHKYQSTRKESQPESTFGGLILGSYTQVFISLIASMGNVMVGAIGNLADDNKPTAS